MENSSKDLTISIKDFQIIKKATLVFSPGLNVIIGQSNNGKSSIFRALKTCLYNDANTTSIRNGCDQFAIGIQTDNNTIICQRGKSTTYRINGEMFQKVGRAQLPEVAEATNIKELNLNGTNEQLNFWDQMEKPFLLDRSETDLFRFIVDSGKDNNITIALKSLIQDRQQITKDISLLEGKIAQIENTIEDYKDKLKDADEILDLCNRVISIGPEINRLNDIKIKVNDYKNTINKLNEAKEILDKDNLLLNNIDLPAQSINTKLKTKNIIIDIINNYKNKSNILKELKDRLESIKFIEEINIDNSLSLYNEISSYRKNYIDIESRLKDLKSFTVPNISDNFIKDFDLYKKLNEYYNTFNSINYNITNTKNILLEDINLLNDTKKELDSIGICPTCGQPLHSN